MLEEHERQAAPSLNELWGVVQAQQARIAELEARDERREAELEQQRVEKLSLVSRLAEVERGRAASVKRLSRAGLLRAAAGAAGLAAGTLTRPDGAAADTGGSLILGESNGASSMTNVFATSFPLDQADWPAL